MPTPRERARAQTMADIVRIGRAHLAAYGAAGLSLRAVARDLGVVSSAIYRYVPSRDDLLTLLIVDAYDDLGDAVDARLALAAAADDADDTADLAARWLAIAEGVRSWALANPARYGLLYGAPVPGYAAPAERTTGPGTRVIAAVLQLAVAAEARPLESDRMVAGLVPASLDRDAAAAREGLGIDVTGRSMLAALEALTGLFGAVNAEVFGQYGADTFSDPDEVFAAIAVRLGAALGIRRADEPTA